VKGPWLGFPSELGFRRLGLKEPARMADTGGGMPRVQIHCYGCDATVPVATDKSAEDLNRAGWSLAQGETYCPKCAPVRAPVAVAASQAADDLAGAGTEDGEARDGIEPASGGGPVAIAGGGQEAERTLRGRLAASTLARIPLPKFGRGEDRAAKRRLPPLRPAATLLVTTLRFPFKRTHGAVTSRSKVSSQTIVLFCVAVALTLATLGSEHQAIRLPGVLFSFAAGLSWLHDLRSSS
jgi:hypothetical protein